MGVHKRRGLDTDLASLNEGRDRRVPLDFARPASVGDVVLARRAGLVSVGAASRGAASDEDHNDPSDH
jgi:hypothetical protein